MEEFIGGFILCALIVWMIPDGAKTEEYLKGVEVCSKNGGVESWHMYMNFKYVYTCKDGAEFTTRGN